jgi:Tfp pilus assembly protein PilE
LRTVKPGGYSLLEVVVALFLLGTSALFVMNVFHVALQRSRSGEARATARLLVEQEWSELKAWSKENYVDSTSLSLIDGKTIRPPEHSDFELKVSAVPWVLSSPSKEFEMAQSIDERRTIEDGVGLIEVVATWQGTQGSGSYSVAGLLPAAPRALARIEVSVDSSTVGRDGTTTLRATALDSEGRVINGASFDWWVLPDTGNGTISPLKPNNQAELIHRITLLDGTVLHSDGRVKVGVGARLDGKVVTDETTEVTLAP